MLYRVELTPDNEPTEILYIEASSQLEAGWKALELEEEHWVDFYFDCLIQFAWSYGYTLSFPVEIN
jgi:hypothetical protein